MNELDAQLLPGLVEAGYDLARPVAIAPLSAGMNNRSFLISSAGSDYVLKWHQNTGAIERIRLLDPILAALERMHLPFAIPLTLRSRAGGPMYAAPIDGSTVILTLTPRIDGRSPVFGDHRQALVCGQALGLLDQALRRITLVPGITAKEPFPVLDDIHPEVSNPTGMAPSILTHGDVAHLLVKIEEVWLERTRRWPKQLIHGDFYPTNVLMVDASVSGVLDFEYSGPGHRAMDFATGLGAFGVKDWTARPEWPLIEAFASGYMRHSPLTPEEREGVPDLLLKREATSFVHWLGRMHQGLIDSRDMRSRGERLIALERWVYIHREHLVEVLDCVGGTAA
jgi:homoserine kinase type II